MSAIWRATLSSGDTVEERPVIRSTGREVNPVWSPDGTKIADVSDQSGSEEIFVSDADGRNRVQITQSKDRASAACAGRPMERGWSSTRRAITGGEVFTIPAASGNKPVHVLLNASNATYSNDGMDLLPVARPDLESDGGRGKSASHRAAGRRSACSIGRRQVYLLPFAPRHPADPAAGGEEEEAFVPEHECGAPPPCSPRRKGVYNTMRASGRSMVVSFYDFATKKSSVEFRMKNADRGNGALFQSRPTASTSSTRG